LNVSEQQAEQTSGEHAVSPSSDAPAQPAATSWQEKLRETASVESPGLAPAQAEAPKVEAPKAETPKSEASKSEAPKAETPKVDAPKVDAPKADTLKADAPKPDAPRVPGKVLIMSSGDRAWANDDAAGPEVESEKSQGMPGKRRIAAMAAVVALAAMAGVLGGALATAGFVHFAADEKAAPANRALEASVAKIESDLLNLKVSIEHTSKMGMSQFNKTSDRLDRVEKAQAETPAKLAKLNDAMEKLRAAASVAPVPVAAAPAAAKDITGSISPPATAPAAEAPKVEVARLPTVEGWVLREATTRVALIESRRGMYEVYPGDPIPGLGKVDAIRKQDGRWVVVTSKGLIVER
jgi:hypothetical protein